MLLHINIYLSQSEAVRRSVHALPSACPPRAEGRGGRALDLNGETVPSRLFAQSFFDSDLT